MKKIQKIQKNRQKFPKAQPSLSGRSWGWTRSDRWLACSRCAGRCDSRSRVGQLPHSAGGRSLRRWARAHGLGWWCRCGCPEKIDKN